MKDGTYREMNHKVFKKVIETKNLGAIHVPVEARGREGEREGGRDGKQRLQVTKINSMWWGWLDIPLNLSIASWRSAPVIPPSILSYL